MIRCDSNTKTQTHTSQNQIHNRPQILGHKTEQISAAFMKVLCDDLCFPLTTFGNRSSWRETGISGHIEKYSHLSDLLFGWFVLGHTQQYAGFPSRIILGGIRMLYGILGNQTPCWPHTSPICQAFTLAPLIFHK